MFLKQNYRKGPQLFHYPNDPQQLQMTSNNSILLILHSTVHRNQVFPRGKFEVKNDP